MYKMKIKGFVDIGFKQATSKRIKCRCCLNCVDGVDGYIKIKIYKMGWNEKSDMIVFCNKCFEKGWSEIEKAKENKVKTYEELIKKGILKSLK